MVIKYVKVNQMDDTPAIYNNIIQVDDTPASINNKVAI